MFRRLTDLLLLLVLVIGSVWAWNTAQERTKLQTEFDRLVKTTGDLPIGDPSQVHILAIPTGEPLHFAWRIYLPPNYSLITRNSNNQSIASNDKNSREFIARVRFQEQDGELKVFDSFEGSHYGSTVADKDFTSFLGGRWPLLTVEQLGANGVVTADPDDSATLLRLSIPETLDAEARRTLKSPVNSMIYPVLYSIEIGSPNPKKAKAKSTGKSNP